MGSAPASIAAPVAAQVRVLAAPGSDWRAYVAAHPDASIYHQPDWIEVARLAFGSDCFYLEARDGQGQLTGVLPLVRQRSLLLGARLVSLPYCNYGGVLATDATAEQALLAAAIALARTERCASIELRQRHRLAGDAGHGWNLSLEKVTFELALPASVDRLLKDYGAKLRSQVKRAEREGLAVRTGPAALPDFYRVFAENMHDLGTPVYPRRFFETVLGQLGAATQILVLDLGARPVAAGWLLRHRDGVELPWAACTAAGKAASGNMRLYFELQSAAIRGGATSFDFGRCSVDTGTYRFKAQWGGERQPLHWYRWKARHVAVDTDANIPAAGDREGRLRAIATALWQRLPLPLANRLGPWLSPGLPW
jgi:serine/alanine adding enzyme